MASKLTPKVDEIIERIIEGATFKKIANECGVSVSTLHEFLSKPEHSARVKAALDLSASQYANKAEEVLQTCEGSKEEIMRARELAQHYRWMAGKRAPKKYGDKIDVTSDGEKIQGTTIIWGDKRINV